MRKKRKETIFAAAQTVFAAQGYHQATMEEIAQEAGLAKGTLYLYFKSKQELCISLMVNKLEELRELCRVEAARGGHGLEKIQFIVRAMKEFSESNRDFLRMLFAGGEEFRQEMHRRTSVIGDEIIRLITGILEKGIEAGELRDVNPRQGALALAGMVSIIIFNWIQSEDAAIPDDELVDLFAYGVMKVSCCK
ncbi:MAG: TetR/AcrR family transcriptional regulator [Limnochordia bacterium]